MSVTLITPVENRGASDDTHDGEDESSHTSEIGTHHPGEKECHGDSNSDGKCTDEPLVEIFLDDVSLEVVTLGEHIDTEGGDDKVGHRKGDNHKNLTIIEGHRDFSIHCSESSGHCFILLREN